MKLYKLYVVLSLWATGSLGLASCSDFLKEEPYAFVGPDQLGNDNAAVDLWLTGVYSKWGNNMFRYSSFPRCLELDSDYITGPDWAFSNLGAGNFQADEYATSIWTGCYNLIHRANVAIHYVNEITGADEKVKRNALGELYFQKAFSYFLLTRAYGEIPLFDVAISEGASYNQPRRPIPDVYAEIIRLLEQAAGMMYKNTDAEYQKGHVAAGTAIGLLAKVYATMGAGALPAGEKMIVKSGPSYSYNAGTKILTNPVSNTFEKTQVAGYESLNWKDCYEKAAYYAGIIMGRNPDVSYGTYRLLSFDELWKKSGFDESEHMFSVRTRSADEEYGNGVHQWYCGMQDAGGVLQKGPWVGNRFHWYCLFDNEDYRITKGVKHRFQYDSQVKNGRGYYYPGTPEYKLMATGKNMDDVKVQEPVAPFNDGLTYTNSISSNCLAFTTKYADVTDPTIGRTDAYWPFLRYADIVLIYAEAQCELNDGISQDAIDALNDIRIRSNAKEASVTGDGAIETKVVLRSVIFEERAKELAYEGDRRWDLLRWGIYLDVMNSLGGINEDGTRTPYDEGSINKRREFRHLLYPLPSLEVSTNMAIDKNNPGWN